MRRTWIGSLVKSNPAWSPESPEVLCNPSAGVERGARRNWCFMMNGLFPGSVRDSASKIKWRSLADKTLYENKRITVVSLLESHKTTQTPHKSCRSHISNPSGTIERWQAVAGESPEVLKPASQGRNLQAFLWPSHKYCSMCAPAFTHTIHIHTKEKRKIMEWWVRNMM